jgi:hypothetical protein
MERTEPPLSHRQRYGEGEPHFPPIPQLAATVGPLDPMSRDYVNDWNSLTPELQAMVPHVGRLIAGAIGGPAFSERMRETERNFWGYTAAALLAEAHRLAQFEIAGNGAA